ncbi:MAG: ATP-dependent metallopeptidase FtsH/Yme1/Tma family protein [Chloroflexi bacterium]|nr:MAG: ATP-dependent metallopeptidase FtsH/Yme1/Tma family protein [Chloroflexota bacterium]TME48505.1 MAG: ATP-dependent metallopeptidase FtsH/Yme1/Tma family protein [Chloroflexota bacterium]
MKGRNRNIFYFVLVAGVLAIIWASYKSFNTATSPTDKSTYDLIQAADNHQVASAVIKGSGTEVDWTDTSGIHYKTTFRDTYQIEAKLLEDNVHFSTEAPSSSNLLLSVVLPNVILFLVIGGFMWYMLRQTQSGNNQAISFGRSRARLLSGDKPAVTFNDVAGVEEAKQELTEIVEFLKFPEKFTALGARIPKGVLMVGPPGTGKTLLSKAVAGEAGVPFFSISGSEFVEMFVGVGASRVRDLFDQAKKNSPCIVFVDEIDAVGRQRGAGLGGGHDEREQTLNQLLVEMDGFETNTHVIVIAATNRPDVLDPALLRPGRFDRHVTLDRPDIRGRRAILEVHARNKPFDGQVDLEVLARQTPGFSGADLSNLINEAAILAARNNKKAIGQLELEEAIARVIAGPERKSRMITEQEKNVIAYHEIGHALVAKSLPNADPVHKVSIISRGMALGWTMQLPTEDRYLVSRSELNDDMAVILGGRVAEELIFGDITSGASDDIGKATKLARRMVTEWGMSDKLGPLTFGHKEELVFLGRDLGEQRNYSEEIAGEIDQEVHRLVDAGYQRARKILTERRDKLVQLAEYLKTEETIEGWQMDAVLNSPDGKVPERPAPAKPEAQRPPQVQPKADDRGPEIPPGRLEPTPA